MATTTFIYITSLGYDPSDFSMEIPEDQIRCRPNEYIRLSLVQHTFLNQLYNVTETTCRIGRTTDGATYEHFLEPGTYRISELTSAFNELSTGVSIEYLPKLNKFLWTNRTNTGPNETTLTFQGTLAKLFGVGSSLTVRNNLPSYSPFLVTPQAVNDLVIKLTHALAGPPVNLSNLESAIMTTSTIFAVVPVRAAPHQLNVFHNFCDSFSTDIYDSDLQRIGFRVVDSVGNVIKDMPHWSAVIKVQVLQRPNRDVVAEKLDKIIEFARLMFLQCNLPSEDEDEIQDEIDEEVGADMQYFLD